MINTTVKVITSSGSLSAEETVIVQSAGDMDMPEDVKNHMAAVAGMVPNIEYAVSVTIERVQDKLSADKSDEPGLDNEVEAGGTNDTNDAETAENTKIEVSK